MNNLVVVLQLLTTVKYFHVIKYNAKLAQFYTSTSTSNSVQYNYPQTYSAYLQLHKLY